jgi:hypothetical protein
LRASCHHKVPAKAANNNRVKAKKKRKAKIRRKTRKKDNSADKANKAALANPSAAAAPADNNASKATSNSTIRAGAINSASDEPYHIRESSGR